MGLTATSRSADRVSVTGVPRRSTTDTKENDMARSSLLSALEPARVAGRSSRSRTRTGRGKGRGKGRGRGTRSRSRSRD